MDEPYRRALSGIYARLAATARAHGHDARDRDIAVADAAPYSPPRGLRAPSSTIIADSLPAHGGGADRARARCAHLRRAVEVFGFHLAPLDMRQHSGVHEAGRRGAVRPRRRRGRATPRCREPERRRWLLDELALARPLRSPYVAYSAVDRGELEVLDAAAAMHRRYGARGAAELHHLQDRRRERRAGGGAAR